MKKFDLEDRLISFADAVLSMIEQLPKTNIASHLGNQLIRSCTAPALNYGEAQGAESQADFVHKMKICLKELRETRINLKLLKLRNYLSDDILDKLMVECNELTAIVFSSIRTAKINHNKER